MVLREGGFFDESVRNYLYWPVLNLENAYDTVGKDAQWHVM